MSTTKKKPATIDPTARWKKLSPTDRYLAVSHLIGEVKGWEINRVTLAASINLPRSNSLIARNKAILAVLRALLEPELWDEAVRTNRFDPFAPNARSKLRARLKRPDGLLEPW